jgi:hypothetical protein
MHNPARRPAAPGFLLRTQTTPKTKDARDCGEGSVGVSLSLIDCRVWVRGEPRDAGAVARLELVTQELGRRSGVRVDRRRWLRLCAAGLGLAGLFLLSGSRRQ